MFAVLVVLVVLAVFVCLFVCLLASFLACLPVCLIIVLSLICFCDHVLTRHLPMRYLQGMPATTTSWLPSQICNGPLVALALEID